MATNTYAQFLKTIRPGMLGPDGRFLGPQGGANYMAEGMTPQEFFDHMGKTMAPGVGTGDLVKAHGAFGGGDDFEQGDIRTLGNADASWMPGEENRHGMGWLTSPENLKWYAKFAALAVGGAALAGGGAGAGAAAGGLETGGAAGIGSGTALGGAGLGAETVAAGGAGGAGLLGGTTPFTEAGFAANGGWVAPSAAANAASVALPSSALGTAAAAGVGGTVGGLLGNESAAETARLGAMNAGTDTLGGISAGSTLNAGSGLWDTASNFLKDNLGGSSGLSTLAKLGGAALGAASAQDGKTSASTTKDPWGPAQPYLLDNLKTNANAQEHYRQNPFSNEQQQAYQGLLNTNANSMAASNGLLGHAQNFMQSNRGVMPAFNALPTAQGAPIDWSKYANIGRR